MGMGGAWSAKCVNMIGTNARAVTLVFPSPGVADKLGLIRYLVIDIVNRREDGRLCQVARAVFQTLRTSGRVS
jgi:hypothetical protein